MAVVALLVPVDVGPLGPALELDVAVRVGVVCDELRAVLVLRRVDLDATIVEADPPAPPQPPSHSAASAIRAISASTTRVRDI